MSDAASGATPNVPPAARVEELVGRVSVTARRWARPVGIAGWVGLAAGVVVWLALPAPVWPNGPPVWSSLVSLAVLGAPGLWLVFHRRWLDRAFVRASELAPAATTSALETYARARARVGGGASAAAAGQEEASGGRLRRAWRFYRGTVSPLREHVSDALGVTLPFRPYVLAMSGVAFLLCLVLVVCIPVAIIGRLVLLVT